jgi:hypothetical protein
MLGLRTLSIGLVGLFTATGAFAQAYPERPITMIVPFAAGGTSDVIARVIGEAMGKNMGRAIINENVAGAGGVIALTRAAQAKPDGYTILIGNTGTNAASYVLAPDVKYKTDSFMSVGLIAKTAPVLAIKNDFPAKTLEEFVAYAKANPGVINLGREWDLGDDRSVGIRTPVIGTRITQLAENPELTLEAPAVSTDDLAVWLAMLCSGFACIVARLVVLTSWHAGVLEVTFNAR